MNQLENTSILCSNVPIGLLSKNTAIKHFQSFGSIVKITVRPKTYKIIVQYKTPNSAKLALQSGNIHEGEPFNIEYTAKRKRTVKNEVGNDPEVLNDPLALAIHLKKQLIPKTEKSKKKEVMKKNSSISKQNDLIEKELLNVLKQQAVSVDDKYKILEARDKLIRIRKNRQLDLTKSKTTIGTCPDMCPEKERLMREAQHQVSMYEQEPGERRMNHSIAVKQYSRSSADQEMPLPHELRNVSVLQMTMEYLMYQIMDECDMPDVNLAEWFHFLWDRTRGIRKDITQQELCCLGSVELVEQCARFHIHCSARLVAEDPSVFDQKINTENLTKCLQTLKYMYHDLAVKGIVCPHESEFRAYIILLNLNDGNFMWEVQQLQVNVQRSDEIKFALNVYSSLDKNNFIRFFKLVRSTTYMNACILLRYFLQVRMKALQTIVQCYTPRMTDVHIPIEQLTEMLCFEGRKNTIDFLLYHGLSFNRETDSVVLNKKDFTIPDTAFSQERAINVIEWKRSSTVGTTVCGHQLPPPKFQLHKVQNSFNEDGFIDLSEFAADETDQGMNVFTVEERSSSPYMELDTKDSNSMEERNIFIEDSNSHPNISFSEDVRFQESPFSHISSASNELQQDEVEMQQKLFEEESRLKKSLAEKQLQKEREHAMMLQQQEAERIAEEAARQAAEARRLEIQMYERQLIEKQNQEAKRQAELEKQRQRTLQLKLEQERKLEEEKQQKILEIRIQKQQQAAREAKEAKQQQEIKQAVHACLDDMLAKVECIYIDNRLKDLKTLALARRVLSIWRCKINTNRRKRKAIDMGPLWPSCLTTAQVAAELFTENQDDTLSMMKRYKSGVPVEFEPYKQFPIEQIDIARLTSNELMTNSVRAGKMQTDIYWNIAIYYTDSLKLNNIVDKTIGWDQSRMLLRKSRCLLNNVTYCLHKCTDEFTANVNGIVIIVNEINDILMHNLTKYLNELGDKEFLPIVFIVQENNEIAEKEIDTLCRVNRLISEYDIISTLFTSVNLPIAVAHGLKYLATLYKPSPELYLNTLKAFILDNLGLMLFQRIRSYARWNSTYKKIIERPNIAIGIVNEALNKLKNIALNPDRLEYATFPPIFKDFLPSQIPDFLPCDFKYFPSFWEDKNYEKLIDSAFTSITIPKYSYAWAALTEGSYNSDLAEDLQKYCEEIFGKKLHEHVFYKIVGKILSKNSIIQWIDIIEIILEEKLTASQFNLSDEFKDSTVFNQLFVVYHQQDIDHYNTEPWYYMKNALIAKEVTAVNYEEFISQVRERRDDSEHYVDDKFDKDLFAQLTTTSEHTTEDKNTPDYNSVLEGFQSAVKDLELSMSIQKQISEKFQENLKILLSE